MVAEDTEVVQVTNTLGVCLPSLNIFYALPDKLKPFLKKFKKATLACSGLIRSVSKEVVEHQLNHAQKEYLDQKVSIFFSAFQWACNSFESMERCIIYYTLRRPWCAC